MLLNVGWTSVRQEKSPLSFYAGCNSLHHVGWTSVRQEKSPLCFYVGRNLLRHVGWTSILQVFTTKIIWGKSNDFIILA